MKYKDFYPDLLKEVRLNVPVIIVDVQPAYDKSCGRIVPKLMSFLNGRKGKILCFYNGDSMGFKEEKRDLPLYYLENGLDENILDDIKFIDKGYGFFRNWMDMGMDRGHIIKAIRYMVMKGKTDSRDVTEEEWKSVFGDDWDEDFTDIPEIVRNDMISVPDISVAELKTYNGCYLCGGEKDYCLAELRLLLDAFNIKYKLIKEFIY